MGAGFERDINRRPLRLFSGLFERLRFRMRAATVGRAGLCDHGTVLYNDAADGRVRPDTAQAPARKVKRGAHMTGIGVHNQEAFLRGGLGDLSRRLSSSRKSLKSSGWRKSL